MKFKKIFNTTVFCLFVIFLSIYGASKSGYYEYENKNKTILTESKIKEFERDIENGKNVNIKDYLVDDTKHYDNKITHLGTKLSKVINNGIISGLEKSFKVIEKMVQ